MIPGSVKIKTGLKIRPLFLVLAIVLMAGIFYMSSRDADESTDDSCRVGLLVGQVFIPGFNEWSEEKQLEFAEKYDHPIRKTAHVSEYALLAILFSLTFAPSKKKADLSGSNMKDFLSAPPDTFMPYSLHSAVLALILCAIYASTDEFHQLFVPGRAGMVQDVLIDSCGALAGCLLVLLIRKIRK